MTEKKTVDMDIQNEKPMQAVERGEWKTVCDFFTIESQEPFRLQQHTGTKEIRVIPAGE